MNIFKKLKSLVNLDETLVKLHNQTQYNNRVNWLNNSVLNNNEKGISEYNYNGVDVIVSLTTYGRRLYDVYLTIESIMQQSRKANKIVLWLSDDLQQKELPMLLQLQQKRGLDICYCKDIRSYKKLIPALKQFPNDVIITVDDDVLYDIDMLDKLIIAYLQEPNYVHYNRGHKMRKDANKKLEKYANWEWFSTSMETSPLNFPTGVGGILYPPFSLSPEVFNEDVFLKISPHADDVWFKAMSLLNGTGSKKCFTRNSNGEEYLENSSVQDVALYKINYEQNQNDIQIRAVFDKYDLYKLL